jgi:hypothetical protein
MRKYLRCGYVVLACLPALVGCCRKKQVQVVLVTPDYYIVNSAKTGDTLEWRAFIPGQDEFVIHFSGQSPCKDDQGKPVTFKQSKNGVVSCKLTDDGQYEYTYFIDNHNYDEPKEKDAAGPRQCGGCRTQQSPGSGAASSSKAIPVGNPSPAVTDGSNGNVIITCDPSAGTPVATGPYAPGTFIYWEPNGPPATTKDWSVTFPTSGGPLCTGGATTFNAAKPLCTLLAPIPPGTTYYFSVTTGECSKPGTFPVPAPAPPPPPK